MHVSISVAILVISALPLAWAGPLPGGGFVAPHITLESLSE